MHLTLSVIAAPLPDVDGLSDDRAGLIVVRPFAHDGEACRAVEHDERELLQVELMDQRAS
jgi:hypothetical protein